MFHRCAVTVLLVWLLAQPSANAADLWVDVNNPECPGDGSSESPFCRIQDAIDIASNGDTILIRPGTYEGSLSVLEKSLSMRAAEGVAEAVITGGFPALTASGSRDLRFTGLTFRSSGGPNSGIMEIRDSTVSLEDCCVTDGISFGGGGGGGINATRSTLHLVDCRFERNRAAYTHWGGAIALTYGAITATRCAFRSNTVGGQRSFFGYGGAISAFNSNDCRLEECTFEENSSAGFGGAVFFFRSDATITNCTFLRNEAWSGYQISQSAEGGGVCCSESDVRIYRSFFCGNTVRQGSGGAAFGGGVHGATLLESSVICHNSVETDPLFDLRGSALGGGASAVTLVANSHLASNETYSSNGGAGGGVSNSSAVACTIVANVARGSAGLGGGSWASSVQSTILWNNEPDQYSDAEICYSNVMGGAPGVGNIDADPLFLGLDDYRLSCKSPCVDAGQVDAPLTLPLLDASGLNYRVIGPRIDMGAYEVGLQWSSRLQHKGGRTRLAFEAGSPVWDPKTLATVFISLQEAPVGGGLELPDGTGRRLGLAPDIAFRLWLTLPQKHRTTSLRGCEGAITQSFGLPPGLPSGLRLFDGGIARDETTGDFISVSNVGSVLFD